MDGKFQVRQIVHLQTAITYASNVTIDFAQYASARIDLTGNITFALTGDLFGSHLWLRVKCDGTQRTLTFPGGWTFVGAAAPANIAANKTAILELWSQGTTDSTIVARWTVQP